MRSRPIHTLLVCGSMVAVALIAACGGQNKLDEADARIQALSEKGAPDSLLATPKVHLFQARSAKKVGNSGLARRSTDSLMITLAKVESDIQAELQKLAPYIDSLRKSLSERKNGLSGLQLRQADSMAAIIDTFAGKNWLLQARLHALRLDTLMPLLLSDEGKMQSLRPKVIGTWAGVQEVKGEGQNAVEKRTFKFGKDGSLDMSEEMKGQTGEYLKEDWKFVSKGTYDLKGDTIFMKVGQEKCVRQIFWFYRDKDGRKQWIKEEKPTYDSTITSGSKDRFVTFDYLKETFDKK